jgi:hypothetical protein
MGHLSRPRAGKWLKKKALANWMTHICVEDILQVDN